MTIPTQVSVQWHQHIYIPIHLDGLEVMAQCGGKVVVVMENQHPTGEAALRRNISIQTQRIVNARKKRRIAYMRYKY